MKEETMVLGTQKIWWGRFGTALATAVLAGAAVSMAQTQTASTQQQVPDAPKPQTLPQVNPLSPAGPAMPIAPTPSSVTGNTVPAALPPVKHADDGPEPIVPAAGQALKVESELTKEAEAENNKIDTSKIDSSGLGTPIRVHVQYVNVPFTVKDSKGKLVPGLTWRDVRILENGLRQQPRLFTVDPYPLSVALVLDQSVTTDTMDKINSSLSALQGAFSPYDEVAVFTYNNGVTKQTAFTAAQSARLGVILERSKGKGREANLSGGGPLEQGPVINNGPVDPNVNRGNGGYNMIATPEKEYHTLLDAIFEAAKETSTAARGRRRVVYVVSDGKEYGSKVKEKELIKYLQTNKIEVYATLVGDAAIPGLGFLDHIHLPLTMRDNVLPRIATVTGGQVDPEFRPKGIEQSFARLTEEVRTQYTIGYYTHASPLDERFRKIEVLVLRNGLTVIAEDGYYPSAADNRPQQPASSTPSASTPSATP